MEKAVLTDRNRFPTEEIVYAHLGRRRVLWDALFAYLRDECPGCTTEWRYYNDGNSWLLNASRRKKTIFWLSLTGTTFRITGYFTDKAAEAIRRSALPSELKKPFLEDAGAGKLRRITITVRTKSDFEHAKTLIALKAS
jgi:hypothetical protein